MYVANEGRGRAGAILTSMKEHKPVRVFRSSGATDSLYRALTHSKCAQYRYDGVYCVVSVETINDSGRRVQDGKDGNAIYQFKFERNGSSNAKSMIELIDYAVDNNTLSPKAKSKFSCRRLAKDECTEREMRRKKRMKMQEFSQHTLLEKLYSVGN